MTNDWIVREVTWDGVTKCDRWYKNDLGAVGPCLNPMIDVLDNGELKCVRSAGHVKRVITPEQLKKLDENTSFDDILGNVSQVVDPFPELSIEEVKIALGYLEDSDLMRSLIYKRKQVK